MHHYRLLSPYVSLLGTGANAPSKSSTLSLHSPPPLYSLYSSQALMLLVLWLGSLISYYPLVIRQSILSPRPVRPDQIFPSPFPLAFTKVRQTMLPPHPPPPPSPSTPSCTCSSSAHLLTGCHVQQPSPRQCLAFLSPLTAARVKPLGFAQTGIQLEGNGRTCRHDLSAALTHTLPPAPATSRQGQNTHIRVHRTRRFSFLSDNVR